ncbi:hypothetical protein [Streptomyces sp. NPDC102360]|uniref:hypothetical protein n=1 Tax=Streptomyces sp. NPDC102360 TaxID=3366160 RepID=UPI003812DE8C
MRSTSGGHVPSAIGRSRFAMLLTVLVAVVLPLFLAAPVSGAYVGGGTSPGAGAPAGVYPGAAHARAAAAVHVVSVGSHPAVVADSVSADPRPDVAGHSAPDAIAAPGAVPSVDAQQATDRDPVLGPYAVDGCTACVVQQRARPDHPAGRSFVPDHQGVLTGCDPGTATAAFGRDTAGPGPVPASSGRTHHDNNRAPPASCGV